MAFSVSSAAAATPPPAPLVAFTQEPEDTVLCNCADDIGKTLQCQYEWQNSSTSVSSGEWSVQVEWWKNGEMVAGQSGRRLQLAPCGGGGGAQCHSAGVYFCRLVLRHGNFSGVLQSRSAAVPSVGKRCMIFMSDWTRTVLLTAHAFLVSLFFGQAQSCSFTWVTARSSQF